MRSPVPPSCLERSLLRVTYPSILTTTKRFRFRLPSCDIQACRTARSPYGRLMLFRGRNAERFCAPAVKRLGVEMGVAIRIVERWIAELVDQAFIERRRRGSGRPAECIFLRHPAFDADPPILADHTVPDPPDMAGQDEVLIRHSCRTHPPEMADVDPPNPADAYKEEKESVLKGI